MGHLLMRLEFAVQFSSIRKIEYLLGKVSSFDTSFIDDSAVKYSFFKDAICRTIFLYKLISPADYIKIRFPPRLKKNPNVLADKNYFTGYVRCFHIDIYEFSY